MTDLRPIYLSIALNPLRTAYAAGHAPLLAGYEESVLEVKAALERKDAGLSDEDWSDEITGQTMPNLDYWVMHGQVAESALQAHRKAFTLMAFHAWEKHVCTYMEWSEYLGEKGFGELMAAGWTIDPKGLKRLQKTANCIKHDSAELFDFDESMFAGELWLFGTDGMSTKANKGKRVNRDGHWTDWEDALRLTDEQVLEFFDLVERSGQILASASILKAPD